MQKGSSCFKGIISLERGLLGNYQKMREKEESFSNSWCIHSPSDSLAHDTIAPNRVYILSWSEDLSVAMKQRKLWDTCLICDIVFLWSSQPVGVIDHWVSLKVQLQSLSAKYQVLLKQTHR